MKKITDVGFAYQIADGEVSDQEIRDMIDDVIFQVLGAEGLSAIIKPSQKVVIKVNIVGPYFGERGEKGRGIITDPRVVRYVAEKVRNIIGFDNGADLKVVDATLYRDANPSLKSAKSGFYWAKLDRTGDNSVDPEDVCYDSNGDGILDGTSQAQLVNLDSLFENERQLYNVKLNNGHAVDVAFPKILRTKEQANGESEYCDVFIGLPVFKSHLFLGMTGAVKLHYGIRSQYGIFTDSGRHGHNGTYYDEEGTHEKEYIYDYMCAMHLVRGYDFCIMDCITANRKGPQVPTSGIVRVPDIDCKVDYILTNAMLASCDSVALDVVETAFAGYQLNSIPLLFEAAKNGIGEYDASYIRVGGHTNFARFRQYLFDKYNPLGKYPLENGWGEACVLDTTESDLSINVSTPRKVKENQYAISYEINRANPSPDNSIARVELFVSDRYVDFKIEGDIERGEFILDLDKFHMFKGTSIICIVYAWDKIFNCVSSIERFIINP